MSLTGSGTSTLNCYDDRHDGTATHAKTLPDVAVDTSRASNTIGDGYVFSGYPRLNPCRTKVRANRMGFFSV